MAEQRAEENIRVREITNVQFSWTEGDQRGGHGSFTVQLVLDDGAEEYVLQPTAEDTKVHLEILQAAGSVYFDLDRKVLIPSDIPLG